MQSLLVEMGIRDPLLLTLGRIPVCLPAVMPSGLFLLCVCCPREHVC
jgi:hypothetical protein